MKLFVTTITVINTNWGYSRSYSDYSKIDSAKADMHCISTLESQNHDSELDNEFVSDLPYEFQNRFNNIYFRDPETFVDWANSVPNLRAFVTRTEVEA
ncbi:hypothetical protein PQD76_gp46 [Stenotrophomonas phage BUCT626]|uniref:Uncharacterized protein n=1 Tax=Stenotrophomonas phage BUCT626 TaxID=2860376 RepID=A0AC61NA50_9CAUD|nr:hypothetical protein PQD76_gp46 [Stenotrophomonas phage BUCT626]QYC96750.1 hypothetical protein [Stenotrophomonas phage BUCT626]